MQTTVKGRFIGGGLYQAKEANGKTQFSACVVLEPGEADKVNRAIESAIHEEFGSKPPKGLQDWGVRVGDDEEFEHSFERQFINPKASEDKKPKVLKRVEGELVECEDVYPGCFVHVSVNAYAYKGDSNKGIKPGASLRLRGVMFWKDGDRIGDSFKENEFEGFESEVDEDAFGEEATTSSLL